MKKEDKKYYQSTKFKPEELEGRYYHGEYRKGFNWTIVNNIVGWRFKDGTHPKCPNCTDTGTIIFNSPIFGYEREIACDCKVVKEKV